MQRKEYLPNCFNELKLSVWWSRSTNRLVAKYGRIIAYKPLHVLNLSDDYLFKDPELIAIFKDIVPEKLGLTDQEPES